MESRHLVEVGDVIDFANNDVKFAVGSFVRKTLFLPRMVWREFRLCCKFTYPKYSSSTSTSLHMPSFPPTPDAKLAQRRPPGIRITAQCQPQRLLGPDNDLVQQFRALGWALKDVPHFTTPSSAMVLRLSPDKNSPWNTLKRVLEPLRRILLLNAHRRDISHLSDQNQLDPSGERPECRACQPSAKYPIHSSPN